MALVMPNASRFYKICAFLGLLIVIITLSYAWNRMQQLEQSVSVVFEQIVITNMEVNGLKKELQHINKVLKVADDIDAMSNKEEIIVDDIPYTAYEIERLRNDKKNILLHVKEKELDLTESSSIKKHVMNEVRLLFAIALALLLFGILLSVFGFLAWYFRIELFEDRRQQPR